MYTYKIGYTSCEESYYLELTHEQKFAEEELADMIADAMLPRYLEHLKYQEQRTKEHDPTTRDWVHHAQLGSLMFGRGFEEALGKMGFKRIEYDRVLTIWGWTSVSKTPHSIGGGDVEETEKRIINRLMEKAGA